MDTLVSGLLFVPTAIAALHPSNRAGSVWLVVFVFSKLVERRETVFTVFLSGATIDDGDSRSRSNDKTRIRVRP